MFDDGLLNEVPIVKTIIAAGKTYFNIKEKLFLRNLFSFIREVHLGAATPERFFSFREKMNNNSVFRDKVSDQLLLFIDRHMDALHSKILARLFLAFIDNKISFDKFISLGVCLDRAHPNSFGSLHSYFTRTERANYIRPIEEWEEGLLFSAGIAYRHGNRFSITALGEELYIHGVKYFMSRE